MAGRESLENKEAWSVNMLRMDTEVNSGRLKKPQDWGL